MTAILRLIWGICGSRVEVGSEIFFHLNVISLTARTVDGKTAIASGHIKEEGM